METSNWPMGTSQCPIDVRHRNYRTFVDSGDDVDLSVLTLDRCEFYVAAIDDPNIDLG